MLITVFLVSIVAGCGGAGEKTPAPQNEIKLGFLGAKTGPVANYGIPGEKGMKMAIEEINAKGGVLGKNLVGLYEDNKGESADIANITTKYITVDKVTALVGDPCIINQSCSRYRPGTGLSFPRRYGTA